MSLKVENHYNDEWVDISDYVISGTNPVPYISKNRDWTIRYETWEVRIAWSLQNIRGADYNFDTGDLFKVSNDSKLLFEGYVDKSIPNYDNKEYEVTINQDIVALENVVVDYDTLHTTIVTGTSPYEYRPYSYYPMPVVGVTFLMKVMLSKISITLDTSTVDDTVIAHVPEDINGNWDVDIYYKDLFVGEWELYAINQSVDAYHTVYDDTLYDYNKDKIKCSDLLSELCSILGVHLQKTAAGNYTLMFATDNYSIDDDDKYSYKPIAIKAEKTIDDLGLSITPIQRDRVLCTSSQNNYQSASIGKGSGIDYLEKLAISFIYEKVAFDDSKVRLIGSASSNHTTSTEISCTTAHGLSPGDYVEIFGVAGMTDINNLWLVATTRVSGIVNSTNFNIDIPSDQTYLEGGWIYKDTLLNLLNSFDWGFILPNEISATDPGSIDYAHILNPIKYKVKSLVNDYTQYEIECPIEDTDKTVIENFIDLGNRTSKIIQEVYD